MDADIDVNAIQALVNEIKNDDYIKVDREIVDVETFAKLNATAKPESFYSYETSKDECERILEKLDDGLYTCVERPVLGSTEDKSSLSSIINQQRYSVSYAAVFQQNNLQEHFIVCQNENRVKEVLEQLKLSNENETDNKSVIKIFRTIHEAVQNAPPGQSIIVDDGKYNESVLIDKSVEVKALNTTDKKEEKKVEIIANTGNCFTLQATSARLEGLKIICDTPGNTFCTKTISGTLELENCQLISSSAACFHVNEGARLTIKDCELNSTHSTASLMPESRAVIMDCRFTQPQMKGQSQHEAIVINSGATCILIDCTINSMVSFKPNSYGMLLRCHISTKGKFTKGDGNGVYVQEGAEPLIQECEIFDCVESGIRFDPKSKGVVSHCNIYNNLMFGFLSLASEQFLITDSHIHNNLDCGLRTVDGAKGEIAKTKIVANNRNAILIENGCEIKMKQCEVLDHVITPTGAIFLKEPQEKTKKITKFWFINSICKGNIFGINISGNSDVHITKSQIQFNNHTGVIVEKDGKVEFDDSQVSENGKYQLTCPRPPESANPGARGAPGPAPAGPNTCTAEIVAKDTIFGPYPRNCIYIAGKSNSTFTQNCVFQNNFLQFLVSKKNMSKFDLQLSHQQMEGVQTQIERVGEKPELIQKRENLKKAEEGITKSIEALEKTIQTYKKENRNVNKKKLELDMFRSAKVTPSIVVEGDARCTIEKSEFRSNNSFIEARGSSFVTIINTKFTMDSLNSVKITNNAGLDMRDSTFTHASIGVILEGRVRASITGSVFDNSYGNSIQSSQDGWNLNMSKSKITLGVGDMINLTGKGIANFSENEFVGRIMNMNENKVSQKSGGADTAIHLTGVQEAVVTDCIFNNLQNRGIYGDKSGVKAIRNGFYEVHKFPLLFNSCSIEIMQNRIQNVSVKPENAIHLQDGCVGKICNNSYYVQSARFVQAMGKSSSVQESNNEEREY